MTKKKLDYAVFIGRFQPYHIGHHDVLRQALDAAEHVIIVIGSHNKSPDIRNPIQTEDRHTLISEGVRILDATDRVSFHFQEDHTYNETRWLTEIQSAVFSIAQRRAGWTDKPVRPSVGIVGFDKDHTTFYLSKFPQWETIDILPKYTVSATQIRNSFFSYNGLHNFNWPSQGYQNMCERFLRDVGFRFNLFDEYDFIQEHDKSWANSPHPPIFSTTDALVTQAGHILVVRRGVSPGKGQIALPGGYVEKTLSLAKNTLKELREETRIKLPDAVLTGSIKRVKMYDDANRSTRGRIITQVTHFALNDEYDIPKVAGGDDAKDAFWMPVSQFLAMRSQVFEDHHSIVTDLLGV